MLGDLESWLQIGVGGLMLAALVLGYRKIWVWGWIYQEKAREASEWKGLYLTSIRHAEDVAVAARQHTTLTPEEADVALRIIREAGRLRKQGVE